MIGRITLVDFSAINTKTIFFTKEFAPLTIPFLSLMIILRPVSFVHLKSIDSLALYQSSDFLSTTNLQLPLF